MKINSENIKRQRAIARRMKSGKSLVGLLAGFAVGAAMTGCDRSMRIAGGISCSAEPSAETNAVEEVVGPEVIMGELPAEPPAETNAAEEVVGSDVVMGKPPSMPDSSNAVNEADDKAHGGDVREVVVPES